MSDFDYFSKQKQTALIGSMDAIGLVVKHLAECNKTYAADKPPDMVEKFFYDTLRVSGGCD